MVKIDLFGVFWGSASLFLCLSCPSQTQAQVVPDSTLPVNSAVTVDGSTTTITGGTRAGSNLFHSFEQFSVTTNGTAFFNNPLNIENILTRVTGGSISNIDGLIQGNGSANLFLLNPNGIVFGPNARLDIGGSFLASTASSLVFADGNFSATDPNNTPLLSVNVPLGVQFGDSASAIANQSRFTDSNSNIVGLQVNGGETLALLGGDLNLEGGHLNAPSGRIELGSVAPNSHVNLTVDDAGLTLGYESVQNFQDIQLSQQAVASTSSAGGGDIQIQARELSVRDGSKVSASTEGDRPAGNLTVTAREFVEIGGAATNNENQLTFSTLAATSSGTGNSGNINIQTKKLMASGGGDISVSVFGTGNSGQSGNLTVNASESIELIGAVVNPNDAENFSRSGLFAATEGSGNAGNLTVETPQLTVRDGARISVSTRGPGRDGMPGGKGGSLTVNAEDIQLSGISQGDRFRSGLFALSGEERPNLRPDQATGDGGDLRITTGQLTIGGGAEVSATSSGPGQGGNITVYADSIKVLGGNESGQIFSTLAATSRGTGNSGNITIETRELIASDGADISVTAFGDGGSGDLTIKATESIELIGAGTSPDGSNFSRSGLFAATEGTENGGDLNLETGRLIVKDGARISVSTRGPGENGVPGGQGGNLTIAASESIELSGRFISTDGRIFPSGLFALSGEVRPTIPATAATGNGGDLQVKTDRLTVRDWAEVSVNAQGSGAAGNLNIDARSIRLDNGSIAGATASGTGGNVTLRISDSLQMRRNSEISTTAGGTGNGGNLTIDANLIAAIETSSIIANANEGNGGNIQIAARRGIFQSADSEITASSQLGIDGSVSLNTPDIQTNRELVDLPEEVADPAQQVARVCQKDREDSSSFAIAGRGGLPPRPSDPLSSRALVGFESLSQSAENVELYFVETRNVETRNFASLPESDEIALAPPAQGWFVNDRGELVLTSQTLNAMSQDSSFSAPQCDVP